MKKVLLLLIIAFWSNKSFAAKVGQCLEFEGELLKLMKEHQTLRLTPQPTTAPKPNSDNLHLKSQTDQQAQYLNNAYGPPRPRQETSSVSQSAGRTTPQGPRTNSPSSYAYKQTSRSPNRFHNAKPYERRELIDSLFSQSKGKNPVLKINFLKGTKRKNLVDVNGKRLREPLELKNVKRDGDYLLGETNGPNGLKVKVHVDDIDQMTLIRNSGASRTHSHYSFRDVSGKRAKDLFEGGSSKDVVKRFDELEPFKRHQIVSHLDQKLARGEPLNLNEYLIRTKQALSPNTKGLPHEEKLKAIYSALRRGENAKADKILKEIYPDSSSARGLARRQELQDIHAQLGARPTSDAQRLAQARLDREKRVEQAIEESTRKKKEAEARQASRNNKDQAQGPTTSPNSQATSGTVNPARNNPYPEEALYQQAAKREALGPNPNRNNPYPEEELYQRAARAENNGDAVSAPQTRMARAGDDVADNAPTGTRKPSDAETPNVAKPDPETPQGKLTLRQKWENFKKRKILGYPARHKWKTLIIGGLAAFGLWAHFNKSEILYGGEGDPSGGDPTGTAPGGGQVSPGESPFAPVLDGLCPQPQFAAPEDHEGKKVTVLAANFDETTKSQIASVQEKISEEAASAYLEEYFKKHKVKLVCSDDIKELEFCGMDLEFGMIIDVSDLDEEILNKLSFEVSGTPACDGTAGEGDGTSNETGDGTGSGSGTGSDNESSKKACRIDDVTVETEEDIKEEQKDMWMRVILSGKDRHKVKIKWVCSDKEESACEDGESESRQKINFKLGENSYEVNISFEAENCAVDSSFESTQVVPAIDCGPDYESAECLESENEESYDDLLRYLNGQQGGPPFVRPPPPIMRLPPRMGVMMSPGF